MNQYADNINQLTTIRRQVYIFAAVLVLVLLLSNAIRKWQQQQAYEKVADDPDAQLAFQIRQACNPGGTLSALGWNLIDVDGTDEEALFSIASQIKNLNRVRTFYKDLYKEELLDRLGAELSQDDVKRWFALANNSGTGGPPPKPISGKSLVYAKTTVTMYDASDSRKVVKTYSAGAKLGIYEKEVAITSKGVKRIYVQVIYDKGWIWDSKGLVRKDLVKIV